MKVALMPSVSCNYKCEYCYLQGSRTKDLIHSFKSDRIYTAKEWMEGLDWLSNNWSKIDTIDITGGEPFIYPEMMELIRMVINKYGSINITSNLALLPENFLSLPINKVGLTVSAHLDENGKIRKTFVEKMVKLRNAGFDYVLNFVAYPKQVKKFDRIINLSRTFNRGCHLEPYIDYEMNPIDFGKFHTSDDEDYFNANISNMDALGIKRARERGTKEIKCGVAQKYLVVVENGDIYPCFGFMFENRHLLGNIFDKKLNPEFIRYKTEPITCTLFCPCANNFRDGIR